MKKQLLFLGFLLSSIIVQAQNVAPKISDSASLELAKAKFMLNKKANNYNPQQAFVIYERYANSGNAQAMNALANLYNSGLGTVENEHKALEWYEKAADAGYANAWYNLGNMYKSGIGTTQNFEKAYRAFSKGADLNNGVSLYAKGYMLYKGFGTKQNYEQAAASFKKGSNVQNISSWYMLGLCYRNGYGVPKNKDSAAYYLSKAAAAKDMRAVGELRSLAPERTDVPLVDPPKPPSVVGKSLNPKIGFQKIDQNLSRTSNISGEYQGYIVRFDWSGRHIIAQNSLHLNLEQNNEAITGHWDEDGQEPVYLTAKITDTALVFSETRQAQTDHYHRDRKNVVKFENSRLFIVQSKDSIYLSGNLTSYVPKYKEPEKPQLIFLVRTGVAINTIPRDSDSTNLASTVAEEEERLDAMALQFVAYPNPFATTTNLRYTLRRTANVNVLITDVQTGRTVSRNQQGVMQAGEHTIPIILHERPGNYVVTLQYNNKLKSLILIKN